MNGKVRFVQKLSIIVLVFSVGLLLIYPRYTYHVMQSLPPVTVRSPATWEAQLATREADLATREASIVTEESEHGTRIAADATWEVEYATWEAQNNSPPVSLSSSPAREIQPRSTDWTLLNLWVVALISLATFVATTIFRATEVKRTRVTHELTVAKTQLEIEKLRKEMEEAQQKDEKRKP